ncbi:PepSY domain-containing protein [Aerococcaceae bacterium NML191219]|nr:PepSY domain-containing protein [Aerococcaceae bacterium NML191219]
MTNHKREGLLGSLLLVTGAAIGAASVLLYKENRPKRPGVVLEEAKKQFSQQGTVEGSWIDYNVMEYPHIESKPLVYVGGISRIEDGKLVQYQFICDAYSGEILDIYVTNN